jgi:hypothetical protein
VSVLYNFHVNLFAAPPASFVVTWEEVAARLERLPRMIFELDGSFVISGDDPDAGRWQVDGHLFEFAEHLHRVELHGRCPAAAFDDLLRSVGWPAQALVFEMVREGMTLGEDTFRCDVATDVDPT